ncbi:hypothetical protein OBBRIDRAFT_762366 [Obba rivulosa]|uniref:BTB domain-containing protein n=1 Tax=Obba rivulosa TaxID=1052685 RepID=A0A8E2AP67_9APHY|nr:hypothetical protein OBBRIDRAFT_762366 [Obba rivulosa]
MSQTETKDAFANEGDQRVLTAPFNSHDADIILRSSDKVSFPVHKFLLSRASPAFETMFSLPQPGGAPISTQELPAVELAEDSQTLDVILRLCYPIEVHLPDDFIDRAQPVLEAARKYALDGVMERLGFRLKDARMIATQPLRLYALACAYGFEDVARKAARETLRDDPLDVPYSSTLRCMTGGAYHRLLQYHRECRRVACDAVSEKNLIIWRGQSLWSSSVLFRLHGGCRVWKEVFVGEAYSIRGIVVNYIRAVYDVVAVTPVPAAALRPSFLEAAIRGVSTCAQCGHAIYGEITGLGEMLQSDMEKSISEVVLVFEQ